MKLTHLVTATAAIALLGGAAVAQTKNDVPKAPTPGSVTGDWNGAHAPSDDKQYQEKVVVPLGSTSTAADAAPPADTAAVNPPAPSTADATVTADASASAPAATHSPRRQAGRERSGASVMRRSYAPGRWPDAGLWMHCCIMRCSQRMRRRPPLDPTSC
jgi:hypothetical protein